MNSRVSWSVDGIDPSVRERAEAAARRAGMSLNDWLNSSIGEPAPPNFRAPYDQRPAMPSQESRDVADIHQRLDSITRQIEQISRPAPRSEAPRAEAARAEPAVARQLNDAISRLDARLSQISNPAPARQAQMQDKQRQAEMVERAAAQVYRPSPPLSPASMDFAIAEIAARQNELDGPPPRQMPSGPIPPRHAAPMAPPAQHHSAQPMMQAAPAGPDFSSLERHLIKITSQIEALQRPDHVEQSIAAFRTELAEIRHAITEAMPRRAIESIENEIRTLSRRIDDTRQNGSDGQALAGIERALGEIREALRSLTPAEQLAGYDDAIRNLGAKLDLILRSNDDPSTVQQLESAIAALRGIVSNVASNDALARLADDVHTLSTKVDQLSRSSGNSDSFAMLEQRIAALSSTLENRQPPAASDHSEFLESALRSLTERLDRIPVGNDNASAFAHLEQRVTYLLERLEASDRPAAPADRSRPGRRGAARHPALARTPARQSGLARGKQPQCRRAAADGLRHRRPRQARIVRHPLQPVGNRPPHAGLARNGSQHARPCGRSPVDDRRRSAHGSRRARNAAAGPGAGRDARRDAARADAVAGLRAAALDAVPDAAVDATLGAAAETGTAESGRVARGFSGAFRRRAARIPRRAAGAAADCPADPAARHQRNPGAARRSAAHRDCAGIAAGSPARAGHAAGRAHVFAVGTDRSFRKRDQRNCGRPQGAGQFIELHCRRAPRRAGCRRRAASREGRTFGSQGSPRPRPRAATRSRPTTRPPRTCRPRSARCWLARAWS